MNQEQEYLDEIYSKRENFLSRANQELLRAQRYLSFLSFVSIDTKNLHVTDEHKSNDPNTEVYRKLKQHIRNSIRQTDVVSGFSNGNICILLIETNKEGVNIVKERLDESIKYFLHEVAESGLNWRVTMTCGSFPDIDHTPNTFYGKIDKVLSE